MFFFTIEYYEETKQNDNIILKCRIYDQIGFCSNNESNVFVATTRIGDKSEA
jgi:hypothetical protein